MTKRFLGFISLLYSGIILYLLISNSLKNFLAPSMQLYVKITIIPLIIIGFVMLFNNKVNYKFKISDLVLLIPLIMLIIAGDGKLTSTFASSRATNYTTEERIKSEEAVQDYREVVEETYDYDFSNPYFDIVDANYNELSNYLTFSPKASVYEGKTIKVRGFVLKNISYVPNGYYSIGKLSISCCAADAIFTGFVVKDNNSKVVSDKWYEIEGILEKGKDKDGYDIMYIKVINLKEIDESLSEQYVYPCYAYDDGVCEAIAKYDLEY